MPIDVTLMAKKMRFVVVHYHIFKNAGTTIERILEREFPGAFARLHGPASDCTLDAHDLSAFLEDHPEVSAVTSHHLRYPAPAIRNLVVFDCCFLRHPLDRLDSLYSYFRKIDSTDALCRNAHRLTPSQFMRQLLDQSPEHISNPPGHLPRESRRFFIRRATTSDLARAIETVQQMALPGVVEMFQESMVAAEYYLRPAFPSIQTPPQGPQMSAVPKPPVRQILLSAGARKFTKSWNATTNSTSVYTSTRATRFAVDCR